MYSPDKMMGAKGPTGLHGPITSSGACFAGRYSPTYRSPEPMTRRCMPNPSSRILEDASIMCNSWSPRHNGDIFSGLNDGLISRAEALAAVDIKHQGSGGPGGLPQLKHDMMYHHSMGAPPPVSRPHHQMGHMDGLEMLDPITSSSMTTLTPMSETPPHMHSYGMNHVMNHHHHGGPLSGHGAPGHHPGHHGGHPGAHHPAMAAAAAAAAVAGLHPDADTDPRELEAFAERFKQRRIKLGVTQADVGFQFHGGRLSGQSAYSPHSDHHDHPGAHHPVIMAAAAVVAGLHPDADTNPWEMEAFAERFKQRRIKLGGTQGDVGYQFYGYSKLEQLSGASPGPDQPTMVAAAAVAVVTGFHSGYDTDPRKLEAFAEWFKQRRMKLGVTQPDVGKALANLKLPGVGALSQSTICRFESLTLSHNNMIALKPILQAWLEEAEAQAKNKRRDPDAPSVLPAGEKKRKRTSIAAPEKRSLEAYFAVQPRPSGEKIAAIAEKLDLKKNVVRVWFCNQRQKQKRMKFAAQH